MQIRRGFEAALLAAFAVAAPGRARADGAFPAGEAVLLPDDLPQETILATNFGLVSSEDGGQSWNWTCEQDANALGIFYQLGPAPRHRLFAVASDHVVTSDDASCSWRVAGGLLADQLVTDVFPDPTDADRVLAIGNAAGAYAVFESADGGTTFGSTPYQASAGDVINGVEIARADRRVVYVALMSQDRLPKLARTGDGGATWIVHDLSADLGPGLLRIIAIDPDDPDTLLLRWASVDGGEAIGVTHDGGATARKPLSTPSAFTSFARMPDGALVVGGKAFLGQGMGFVPALFVSRDGGASFLENRAVPGVLALAQRGGVLYAAADNSADGFALGASDDAGTTWRPVLRFDQVGSIRACVRTNAQCQASCEALAGKGLGSPGTIWDEAVCTGAAGNAGAGGSGGAGTAGTVGAGGAGGGGHGSSGGCTIAPGDAGGDFTTAAVLAALIALARPRQRRVTRTAKRE